jgi:diguanylate cyclase (GGDEF)-like protein/PAS domain S-box-containing protein
MAQDEQGVVALSHGVLHTMLSSVDAVFAEIDREGRILFMSKVLEGFDLKQVIGHDFCEWALPAYHAAMRAALEKAYSEGVVTHYEVEGFGPNGSTRWYEGRLSPLISEGLVIGVVLLATDITGRIEAQEKARQQSELLGLFYNLPFIGMAITSPSTKRWVTVNDRLCQILGYPREELVEKTWAEITHPDDLQADIMEFDRVMSGVTDGYTMDKRFMRKNGAVIDATIDVRCIRKEGRAIEFFVATVQDISLRKAQEKRIQHMAHYDLLTDLPNRILLSDRLNQALRLAQRNSSKLAVLYVDLDKFKPVNDAWGHHVGDELLKAAAARLMDALRASDTVARIGGDEFVVLVSPLAQESDAVQIAQNIHTSLGEPFQLSNGNVAQISSSIGVAIYPDDSQDGEDLLQHADSAMFFAKERGRDQIQMFARLDEPE